MGVLNRYSECEYTNICSDIAYTTEATCVAAGETWDITGTVSTAIPSHASSAAFFIKNGSSGTAIVKLQGSCDGTNFYDMTNVSSASRDEISAGDTFVRAISANTYLQGNPACLPMFVKIVVTSGNLGTSATGNIFFAYCSI